MMVDAYDEAMREYYKEYRRRERDEETPEQKAERLRKQRERYHRRIANETPEEKAERKEKARIAQRKRRRRKLVREAYGQSNLTKSMKVLDKLREEMMMSVGDDCRIEDSEVSKKYLELKEEIRRCFESEERQRQIRDWVESRSLFQSDD
jgi:hypothetical protein